MTLVEVDVLGEKKSMYIDNNLNKKIDEKVLPSIKKDDDLVWLVDGNERVGKSVFAQQLARKLDKNFSIEKIAMNPNEFRNIILKSKKGDCVVYDEAFTGLSSRRTLSEINKILVELMMEMGQKNLFVIIVIPTFFLLERYVALFRAKGLFHVYKKRGKRGYWRYYNTKKKKLLYIFGKKFFSYEKPITRTKGRFLNFYTVDEEAYREKKSKALSSKSRMTKDDRHLIQRDALLMILFKKLGVQQTEIAKMLGDVGIKITNAAINIAISRFEKENAYNLNINEESQAFENLEEEIPEEIEEKTSDFE